MGEGGRGQSVADGKKAISVRYSRAPAHSMYVAFGPSTVHSCSHVQAPTTPPHCVAAVAAAATAAATAAAAAAAIAMAMAMAAVASVGSSISYCMQCEGSTGFVCRGMNSICNSKPASKLNIRVQCMSYWRACT